MQSFFIRANDVRHILLTLLLALPLTACGQRGDLYIPQDEPPPAPQSGNASGNG